MRPSAAQPSPCTLRCPRLQTRLPGGRVARRRVAVERDPQDLAVQAVRVLRVGPVARVAGAHVEVAVRADRQPAAVVVVRLVDARDDRRELAQLVAGQRAAQRRGCRRRSSRRAPGRRRRRDEPSTATPSSPPSPSGTTTAASWSAPGPVTSATAPSASTSTTCAASRSVTTARPSGRNARPHGHVEAGDEVRHARCGRAGLRVPVGAALGRGWSVGRAPRERTEQQHGRRRREHSTTSHPSAQHGPRRRR